MHHCPVCHGLLPGHEAGCHVPTDLERMEKVHARIHDDPGKSPLTHRIEFYLAAFHDRRR